MHYYLSIILEIALSKGNPLIENLVILIGVASALVAALLTAIAAHYFNSRHSKNIYKEKIKKELVDRISNCIELIPIRLVSHSGKSIDKFIDTISKNNEIQNSVSLEQKQRVDRAKILVNEYFLERFLEGLGNDIKLNFIKYIQEFVNAWIEFLELNEYMNIRKSLKKYFEPINNFLNVNTEFISAYVQLTKTNYSMRMIEIYQKFLSSKVCEELTNEEEDLIHFLENIGEMYKLLKDTRNTIIEEIKFLM